MVETVRCVFCRWELPMGRCIEVRLADDDYFICCPAVCSPMRDAIEDVRRAEAARRHQLGLPLPAA